MLHPVQRKHSFQRGLHTQLLHQPSKIACSVHRTCCVVMNECVLRSVSSFSQNASTSSSEGSVNVTRVDRSTAVHSSNEGFGEVIL